MKKSAMLHSANQTGTFLLSLDTELAWGYFDCLNPQDFSSDGQLERQGIHALLDLFREFNIHATWAVVGHLFYETCEKCEPCPVKAWEGKYDSFSQVYASDSRLWYGADVINAILEDGEMHEIAFHGYTHRPFNETTMRRDEARFEIEEWLRLAQRKGLAPRTVIFPRNVIGHLELFQEYGFTSYRGAELPSPCYAIPILGRGLKRYHRYLSSFISAPGYRHEDFQSNGLLNLPSSQHLFGFDQVVSRRVNALNLHRWITRTVTDGIRNAAREKKIFHLRAHPNDFRDDKDFDMLRGICQIVSEEVKSGRLTSLRMDNLADMVIREAILPV
ncbi:MAG: hypothetical protein C4583_10570 [Anaerolineaceae bacterium]|nr:MAG: hypothetical protein C4583_10570 [Anaerolineaceae bacterium]